MASGMHQLSSPSRSRHRSRSKSPKRHHHSKPAQPPTKALRTLHITSRSSDDDDVFRLNPGALQNREMQDIRRRLSVSLPVFRDSSPTPPSDTPPERRRSVYLLSNPLTPDPLSDDECQFTVIQPSPQEESANC